MSLTSLKKDLKAVASKEKAKILMRFFKTGPGEYGEGDQFLGVTVPQQRRIAKQYSGLSLDDIQKLLDSKIHEERLVALFILIQIYQKGDEKVQNKIYRFYVKNLRAINNWDLVDSSADKIVGHHLFKKDKAELYKWVKSKNLWERRIAIIATFYDIKERHFDWTLALSEELLNDEHDLIHKAVGWMLREIGKRHLETEEKFLKKHYKNMPRTMLRYAIEKFPEKKRQAYLQGKI